MTNNIKHKNREAWLQAAVALITPLFEKHGYKVPEVRVSAGWPARGGLGKKKRVLGECWDRKASEDGEQPQIFISPYLVDPCFSPSLTPSGVLPTLIHEVVHAVVGHKEKHNKVFGKCARAVGLEGKLTATFASATLVETCKAFSAELGEYPHSKLDSLKEPSKKQSTRMLKCECQTCGYTCRVSNKWLEQAGEPHCPQHGAMTATKPEAKEDDDNE